MRRIGSIVIAAALHGIPAAEAGEILRRAAWSQAGGHVCTCRFRGENIDLGGRRCLATPDGPRIAECVVEQNVTSWRPTGERCPEASLPATPAL